MIKSISQDKKINKQSDFIKIVTISLLLYGYTTWTSTKSLQRKLAGNYIRMLHIVWKKSRKHHTTEQQLYGHLPPIM